MQMSEATARSMGLRSCAPRAIAWARRPKRYAARGGLPYADSLHRHGTRRAPDSRTRHSGGGPLSGSPGAEVQRPRLGHFRVPLRRGMRLLSALHRGDGEWLQRPSADGGAHVLQLQSGIQSQPVRSDPDADAARLFADVLVQGDACRRVPGLEPVRRGRLRELAGDYRSDITSASRAPNRLSVWLRSTDLAFRTCEDIRSDQRQAAGQGFRSSRLFRLPATPVGPGRDRIERPRTRNSTSHASPAAIGTLSYIAFETRRLFEEMRTGESFRPLEVTSLVQPVDVAAQGSPELLGHCSGHVFDVDLSKMPRAQRECLHFVLDDLGWYGYLGFTEEAPGSDRCTSDVPRRRGSSSPRCFRMASRGPRWQ